MQVHEFSIAGNVQSRKIIVAAVKSRKPCVSGNIYRCQAVIVAVEINKVGEVLNACQVGDTLPAHVNSHSVSDLIVIQTPAVILVKRCQIPAKYAVRKVSSVNRHISPCIYADYKHNAQCKNNYSSYSHKISSLKFWNMKLILTLYEKSRVLFCTLTVSTF